MTNKEAKEKLYMEWQKFLEDNIDYAGISEAYKVAFKALEQEPCDDCVSKQAVLDYLKSESDDFPDYHEAIEHILDMLPVTPQPKTGHWIRLDYQRGKFECSECHTQGYVDTCMYEPKWKYCPNCGCHMVEPQERSDKK